MKRSASITLVFVLTAALFTGCGCTNRNKPLNTMPTVMPTTQATTEPTHATTTPATVPDHTVEPTVDHGNGPLEDPTAATTNPTENTIEGEARSAMPRTR